MLTEQIDLAINPDPINQHYPALKPVLLNGAFSLVLVFTEVCS